jgi:hypothetical protein
VQSLGFLYGALNKDEIEHSPAQLNLLLQKTWGAGCWLTFQLLPCRFDALALYFYSARQADGHFDFPTVFSITA